MTTEIQKWKVDQLEVLVFEIMDIRLAADLDQIDEMLEPQQTKEIDAIRLDELMPFTTGRVVYRDPRVLMIPGAKQMFPLLIDQPLDIRQIPVSDIHPFPELVQLCQQVKALWGVVMIQEHPVLLLDFQKLTSGQGDAFPANRMEGQPETA